jgi:hypothetical protein
MAAMNQAKEQAKAEIYRSMKSGGAFAWQPFIGLVSKHLSQLFGS